MRTASRCSGASANKAARGRPGSPRGSVESEPEFGGGHAVARLMHTVSALAASENSGRLLDEYDGSSNILISLSRVARSNC